jgi:tRNA G18 (ribose-2'-O)-methylase SpoU
MRQRKWWRRWLDVTGGSLFETCFDLCFIPIMPVIPLQSFQDPRLAPYRNLKERDLAREGDRFIAEGENLVKRLIASRLATESVLLAERRVAEIAPQIPDHIPVYAAPSEIVNQILGYKFHSGVMAVGLRGPSPSIESVIDPASPNPVTLLICPEIEKTDNLGALIRIAAGFGVDAMLLGERCCDPFFRQSVRVSMGAAFVLPIIRSDDLARDLDRLRIEFNVELIATVLSSNALNLQNVKRPHRLGLLLGNEAQGLEKRWLDLCHQQVTLPMKLGTDSLNVAVAAGIFLYHFTRVTP